MTLSRYATDGEHEDLHLLTTPESDTDPLTHQATDLCNIHDHSTRVIANLDIDTDWFTGYQSPRQARFDLESMVKLFLYMYMGDLGQSELERRFQGATYLYLKFNFKHPPRQQDISYNKRHRFTRAERVALKEAAARLATICANHDVIDVSEPTEPEPEPEHIGEDRLSETDIRDAVRRATRLGFEEFSADRADNTSFALEAYFERQSYLNLAEIGTTSPKRRFKRLSDRSHVPSASAHNETLHKIGEPDKQRTLDEFGVNGYRKPEWKRIRDELLEPFHAGVENIINEVTGKPGERRGIREPVILAIDITTWNYWPSPFVNEHDADPEDIPVTYESNNQQKEKIVKADHPEMVSGAKRSDERAYKFATVTIVMEDTPIVLGVEPVRDKRRWEDDADVPDQTSRGVIVDRLLEQASQHVDFHKVFVDRGFDSLEVRDTISQYDATYVIGKTNRSKDDEEHIEEIKNDPENDTRITHGTVSREGCTHDVTYVYKPVGIAGEEYTIFTITGHLEEARVEGLIQQYAQRMEIEVQYKTIKNNFLPTCASKDYEMRFLIFAVGVLIYNVWRLANFTVRGTVSADLGESPPIQAGEIVELVAFFLFKPGGSLDS